MSTLTTGDIAARLRCSRKKVLTEARALGLGMNLRGRAGMRFTEEDYERLVAAMRPAAPVERRRRRRSA